jgi:hypothetical protein
MAVKKIKQIVEGVTGASKKVSVLSDAMKNAESVRALAKANDALKAVDATKAADAAKAAQALRDAAKLDDAMSLARPNIKIKEMSDEAVAWFRNKAVGDIKVQKGAIATVGDTRKALDLPSVEAVSLPGLTGKVSDAFRTPNVPLRTKEDVARLIGQKIDAPRFGTPDDYRRMDMLSKDQGFQDLYKKADDMFYKGSNIIDTIHNTQFVDAMYTPGRVPHVRSPEFEKFRQNFPQTPSFDKTGLKGKTAAFTGREFPGGVLDENYAMEGRITDLMNKGTLSEGAMKYIEENGIPALFSGFDKSMLKLVNEGPALGKAMSVLDEVMIKYMITDPQFIREFTEVGGKIPYGFSLVPKSTLVSKIEKMAFYAHDKTGYLQGAELLDKMAPNLLINDHVLDLIQIMQSPKTGDLMLTLLDGFNKIFKTTKLMTWGNLWRNLTGNIMNVTLSGMPLRKTFEFRGPARDMLEDGLKLLRKSVEEGRQVLSAAELQKVVMFEDFVKDGLFKASSGKLDIPDNMLKAMNKDPATRNAFESLMAFFGDKNYEEDLLQRMTTYMYAKQNPQTYLRLGLTTPADFVRYSLFDPDDLTKFEKDVMRRMVPFYVWAKKNLVYHMKNFGQRPNAYYRLAKSYDAMWGVFDIDSRTDLEEYKRANMWVPIWVYKDGKYVAIKMNTPVGDFGEFITNPFTKILSSSAAPIRAPFELATNTQILTGLPIEEFKGQKGYNLEFLPRRADYLFSQTGLDVPVGGAARIAQAVTGITTGTMTAQEALIKSPLRSVLSEGDVNKARRSYDYEKLNRIRETMRFYKQEGIEIPTIADIENKEKNNSYNRMRMRLLKNR